jgi:hypothetical protein
MVCWVERRTPYKEIQSDSHPNILCTAHYIDKKTMACYFNQITLVRQSHQNINYQSNLRSTTKEEDIAAAIILNCSFNQNKYEMLFSTS